MHHTREHTRTLRQYRACVEREREGEDVAVDVVRKVEALNETVGY